MESHSKMPGKVLCKFFMSNCCFKGELCPFSHDWNHKPDMRCKYYIRGSCVNGKNCRYDHVKPEGIAGDKGLKDRYLLAQSSSKPLQSGRCPVNLPSISSAASVAWETTPNTLVTLKDDPSRNPQKWIQAIEFVPGRACHDSVLGVVSTASSTEYSVSHDSKGGASCPGIGASPSGADGTMGRGGLYSRVVSSGLDKFLDVISAEEAANLLCPFAEMGHCPFEVCEYLHGDMCDMCNRQCLNPFDMEQQKVHRQACLKMHEREMEKAFQVQGSEEKQCAICLEIVVTKQIKSERRFGLLPNCDHCFCLSCIRKWRGSTHTGKRTIRACPLCRIISYYIIPSAVWIDDSSQKDRLMLEYKQNLGKRHCKHFDMGEGTCPFGDSCFYKHELPDGKKIQHVSRFYETAEGDRKVVKSSTLWDYLNQREENTLNALEEDLENDRLPSIPPGSVSSSLSVSAASVANISDRDWFWLNYEPDIDELDFV